jgi:hypothetical protein
MRAKWKGFLMRRAYLVIAAVAMIAGLGAVGLARAPLASAAPCSGASCQGLDPATTGCNQYDSSQVTTPDPHPLATLVNWYSTGCNANWAQAWLSPAALAAGDVMAVVISTTDSQNPPQLEYECYPGTGSNTGKNEGCDAGVRYGGSAGAYTDMVDGTNTTYAGVSVYDSALNFLAYYPANQ